MAVLVEDAHGGGGFGVCSWPAALLGVSLLALAVFGVTVVKFPDDFQQYVVGDVVVLAAPPAKCLVIEVNHDVL
ncbi:MAG: hypothetical protein OWQ51_02420 [Pyrobaculum arsenaticum]|uniref:hypothetical protein n=1 Tax=Pyrobaculum arsenaticum TaxID=121277 RepID=UPI000FFBA61C|nr:hypothetical protein [Pyrobaculum arsenaticum]MCY0889829.1 hypothetical protein [Pyrobaculum arsenaticum]